jgi:hypothetical protein
MGTKFIVFSIMDVFANFKQHQLLILKEIHNLNKKIPQWKGMQVPLGYKHTKPPRIVITSTIFLHLVFLVLYGDLILDCFACFILLVLNLD